jgi:predicted amidohydrolase YtcJ
MNSSNSFTKSNKEISEEKADIIFYNANIITMDSFYPKAEIVAIKDSRIIAIGCNNHFNQLIKKDTELINCKGMTIIPGFIDVHFHLCSSVERRLVLNLEPSQGIRSISDILYLIKKFTQTLPEGTWIRGKGYNEFYLEEKRHPNRWDLDKVSPNHPVKLSHRTGNAHILNSFALRIIGISKETPDPPDGLIDRDLTTGEPTGILYHMGSFLSEKIPSLNDDQLKSGISAVNNELISSGITSIQDVSPYNNLKQLQIFKEWKKMKLFNPHLSMMFGWKGFKDINGSQLEMDSQINIKGVKIVIDKTTGRILPEPKELCEMVLEIHKRGYQVSLHAIEEEAIEAACSAIEYALKKFPNSRHRHRIEHCSLCPQSLAKRIASLGITVVSHPSFIYYNGERYLNTVPIEQLKYIYPFSSLRRNGVKLVGSSDSPLVNPNPLIGIYSAVTRKTITGDTLLPEEKISPFEALKIYTKSPAWLSFEESYRGSITPGKVADIVVLSNDPTNVPSEEIKDINVEMTIINGKIVWKSNKF